jgi:hypothetical protein
MVSRFFDEGNLEVAMPQSLPIANMVALSMEGASNQKEIEAAN